jgi:hypothetical protein
MVALTFVLALITAQSTLQARKPRTNRELIAPALRKELVDFEQEYGVHFVINESDLPTHLNGFWKISGESTFSIFLDDYLPQLISELRPYPVTLIRKLRINGIICCQNLEINGAEIDGAADYRCGALYFNVFRSFDGDLSEQEKLNRRRATIHHELFHLIEGKMNPDSNSDPTWTDLNPVKFEYAKGQYSGKKHSTFSNNEAGFISDYSRTSPIEDRAEVFSAMMCNLHEMECRGKDDTVLGRKIVRIKEMVAAYSAEMDERFWQRIRYLDRPRLMASGYEDRWATEHKDLEPLPALASVAPTNVYFSGHKSHRHVIHRKRK